MSSFEESGTPHRFQSSKLYPWIFYLHGKRKRKHSLYSLSKQKVHKKRIKEMVGNDIVCSMHGWLVLCNQIDRRNCQLFNPVSMATIQLPLLSRPCYDLCALSCDPNNSNCIVMLIKAEKGKATCCFCRPGDVVWNEKNLELDKKEICSVCIPDFIKAIGCYKDQICIFTFFEKIFLLAANPPFLTLTDLGVELIPYVPMHYRKLQDYLVESDGELFVIRRFDIRIDTYDFVVCKLDISKKKKGLVVVDDLGGRAFFLSSSGKICSAENYGIKANTIYFIQPSDPCIYSFDLQKKVLTFSLPFSNVKRNSIQAEWILLNSPCKLGCKVDIISPPQIKTSTMLQPPTSRSIRKDWSRVLDNISNLVAKIFSSRFVVSDWSELPPDVLISIVEKLSCVSCAHISIACKSWRSIITWAPKKLFGCPIFLHMPSSSIEAFHFINKSRYMVSIPDNPEVLDVQCAKYGWLLMTRYGGRKIFFFNPLTTEKIEIPALPDTQIFSFCFTSFPTSSNCSIFAISDAHSSIYHIRRGVMKWTEVEIPEFEALVGDFELTPYSNPVFHKEIFYWIWGCGNLCTYDPTTKKLEFLVEPQSPCKSVCTSYLFKSGEKLMLVWAERHGKWVSVYELNEASMAWKEVNTLDNKVVFLSRNSSLVTEIKGLEDMIYFNRFVGDMQPLMYSLKTGELRVYGDGHHVDVPDFCDIPEYQIKSTWIEPNAKLHSIRELSWYDVVFNISQLFVID